jgi:hypothetical protein
MPCKESFAVTWQLETFIFSSQKDGKGSAKEGVPKPTDIPDLLGPS